MKEFKCPKCNAIGECFCQEVGGHDNYEDEYIFYCEKCGYIEKRHEDGGSVLGSNWFTKCPFCGKQNEGEGIHYYPPEKLLLLL